MPTNADAIYARIPGCEISHMPDGFVVYQSDKDKVHYLNPTAAMIYELCGAKVSASGIAAYLQQTFSLAEPPTKEVDDCIDQLVSQGLIALC